jgi:glycosyltransferase involved in cell wall biosynthesis
MVLLPILEALSILIRTKKMMLVTSDLMVKPRRRSRVVIETGKLIVASIQGQIQLIKSGWETRLLLAAPPLEAKPKGTRRVIYLKTNLWYGVKVGGSVGHTAGVINGFSHQGYMVDFFTAEPATMLEPVIQHHLIRTLSTYSLPSETNIFRFGAAFQRQMASMSLAQPDFVYQRLSLGDYTGAWLARNLKVPLVVEYNGSEVWVSQNWGTPLYYSKLSLQAEEVILKHAQLIVTVSEVLREELIGRGFPAARILAYPNCIDPAIFDPERVSETAIMELRKSLGLTVENTVATFIGTFGQWHGVEVLAKAIRQMVDEDEEWLRQRHLHFLLVGDGVKTAEVRIILAGAKYQPYYTMTGLIPQAQAPLYLAASDILLSPHVPNWDGSPFFGSPTKLFEYMAMGKGIVASDLEQIGQVLQNSLHTNFLPSSPPEAGRSEMAVLVRPGDVADLIKGIRFLTEQSLWRAQLGRNARAEVLAKYTWDRLTAAIIKQVQQMESERD